MMKKGGTSRRPRTEDNTKNESSAGIVFTPAEELERPREDKYVLRLYVTGMTPRSQEAIKSIEKMCDEHLKGRYELEVVDIYQQPSLAKGDQILAAPTLVKKLPLPLRRIIGDLSKTDIVLLGLDLKPKGDKK